MAPSRGKRLAAVELSIVEPHKTSAQKAGLRYEKKAKQHLFQTVEGSEIDTWWQYFEGRSPSWRRCQTDCFVADYQERVITIFEIKHRFTSDAWWQLRYLYQPVLRAVYGNGWDINVVEVCPALDPSVVIPERVEIVEYPDEWCRVAHPEVFGVYRWRK